MTLLKARKRLVEKVLGRNHARREVQLEALRGGKLDIDVLEYNPTFGLEKFDPKLSKVGKVAPRDELVIEPHSQIGAGTGTGVVTGLNYKYEDYASDYSTLDAATKQQQKQSQETFSRVLLPGIKEAAEQLLRRKTSTSEGEKKSETETETNQVKERLLFRAHEQKQKERNNVEGQAKGGVKENLKLGQLSLELDSEEEFDESSGYTSSSSVETSSLSSSDDEESEVETEEAQEIQAEANNFLSKKLKEKLDVRDFTGQKYLDLLLGDVEDVYDFVQTAASCIDIATSEEPKKSEESANEYFFGKTYDFGSKTCDMWPEFDYSKLESKEMKVEVIDGLKNEIKETEDAMSEADGGEVEKVKPEFKEGDSFLLCVPEDAEKEKASKLENINFCDNLLSECEDELDNLLALTQYQEAENEDVEAEEFDSDKLSMQVIPDITDRISLELSLGLMDDQGDDEECEVEADNFELVETLPASDEKVGRYSSLNVESDTEDEIDLEEENKEDVESTNEASDDVEEIDALENRLRKSLNVDPFDDEDENEGGDELDEVTIKELHPKAIKRNSVNDSHDDELKRKKSSGLVRKVSKFFGRSKSKKDVKADSDEPKPWEVTLDEMEFYASRNLRGTKPKRDVNKVSFDKKEL